MSVTSPNMNLVISTVSVDSGLNWELNLNSSLNIIDQHNHTSGYGVQIPPAGLNINSALSFQGNQAINLGAAVFTAQSSVATQNALYVSGLDLYYNDGSGNVIRFTSGGSVNATSSGISSGAATAAFVSGVLVVNAASNTPANIQGASLLLGNGVSGSKYLTLNPPAAMAANYSLTLPNLPAATSFIQVDTSGNMSAVVPTVQGIQQGMLAVRATGSTVAAGGFASSAFSGQVTQSIATLSTILAVTITTTGRPVIIMVTPTAGSTFAGYLGLATSSASGSINGLLNVIRGSTSIGANSFFYSPGATGSIQMPLPGVVATDAVAAGTYVYSLQVQTLSATNATVTVSYPNFIVYES